MKGWQYSLLRDYEIYKHGFLHLHMLSEENTLYVKEFSTQKVFTIVDSMDIDKISKQLQGCKVDR